MTLDASKYQRPRGDDETIEMRRRDAETLFYAVEYVLRTTPEAVYDTPIQGDLIRTSGRLLHEADIDRHKIDDEIEDRYDEDVSRDATGPGPNPDIIGGGTVSNERCPQCDGLMLLRESTGYISGWECPHCGYLTLTPPSIQ